MEIDKELKIVRDFLGECVERDIKSFEKNDCIYNAFKKFCERKGIEPITKVSFGYKLGRLNVGVKHKKMVNYKTLYGRQGVRLKTCLY